MVIEAKRRRKNQLLAKLGKPLIPRPERVLLLPIDPEPASNIEDFKEEEVAEKEASAIQDDWNDESRTRWTLKDIDMGRPTWDWEKGSLNETRVAKVHDSGIMFERPSVRKAEHEVGI